MLSEKLLKTHELFLYNTNSLLRFWFKSYML